MRVDRNMVAWHGSHPSRISLEYLSGQEGGLAPAVPLQGSLLQIVRLGSFSMQVKHCIFAREILEAGERGQAHLPDLTSVQGRSLKLESGGKPTFLT
jgi:hypothetical protein